MQPTRDDAVEPRGRLQRTDAHPKENLPMRSKLLSALLTWAIEPLCRPAIRGHISSS